jgi:tetratricopeptide (TPR) repeat protein/predicted Ser/Thr protein kinase
MIGTTVGSYRIVSQLGAGGMGVVYKGFDQRLHRHVALKVLPTSVSQDEGRRRMFLREARAASALNDAHIIAIYDIFEHQGTDVLVMELVEGRTLREAAGGVPVAISQAIDWTRQIAEALGVAHGAGIVHRDLKPSNVMVTDRGAIKVLDFGLAKVSVTSDDATLAPETQGGDVLGTLEYMSPEQARGKPVDHRTDIYALGTILYELLTGRRPFVAENRLALLQEIAHGTPPSVRSQRPEVSEVLDDVVSHALARDPQMRFQSMWELAAALKFASGSASSPGSSGAWAPAASPRGALPSVGESSVPAVEASLGTPERRRRISFVMAGAVVAVVAVAVSVAIGRRWSADGAPMTSDAPSAAQVSTATVTAPLTGTAVELTQQGLALLRRYDLTGNIDNAIASLEAAVAKDKASAPAWAGVARAYWRKQTVTRDDSWRARALDAANQAVSLDPYLANAHVAVGLATTTGSDTAAARKAFERALMLDPSNAGAHRGLGLIEKAAGRPAEATSHYTRALASDPTDWELMWLQGEVEYQSARYAEALEWYTRAAEAAPDSPVPHRLQGAARHMLGDFAGAAAAFQTSLNLQPTAGGYANLGTALFFQGHYRESVQAFERAVELQPSNPLQWGNVGDAYRWVPGNADKASAAYARAIQLLREQLATDPSQAVNRSRLALYLAKSGDTTNALAELGQVVTPDVAEVNTLYRAAVTYELAGRRDEALTMLERALDRGYGLIEIRMDPELANLRMDVRYHRMMARFERDAPK